jgi:hypothetical protein
MQVAHELFGFLVRLDGVLAYPVREDRFAGAPLHSKRAARRDARAVVDDHALNLVLPTVNGNSQFQFVRR